MLACENIHFSSLFAAGDVSRETFPAAKSEEKWMFSQANAGAGYMLSILCVRRTIKVKVGIPESFKVGWYPPKKTGSSHLKENVCTQRQVFLSLLELVKGP